MIAELTNSLKPQLLSVCLVHKISGKDANHVRSEVSPRNYVHLLHEMLAVSEHPRSSKRILPMFTVSCKFPSFYTKLSLSAIRGESEFPVAVPWKVRCGSHALLVAMP